MKICVYCVLRTDTNHAIGIDVASCIENANDIMREQYEGLQKNMPKGLWEGVFIPNQKATLAGPAGQRVNWIILEKEIR